MRIVSLLPSATEILFALGAGDHVVGVTFECDHPPEARSRRIVSTSALPEGLTPREIDDLVAARMAAGEDLYKLDASALSDLDADLVVTQDLCAVCAVDVSVVDDALPRAQGEEDLRGRGEQRHDPHPAQATRARRDGPDGARTVTSDAR